MVQVSRRPTKHSGGNVSVGRHSVQITAADITGTTTQNFDTVTLTNVYVLGYDIEIRVAPTSSDGNTTGRTLAVGTTADADAIGEEEDLVGETNNTRRESAAGDGAGILTLKPKFFASLAHRIQLVATGGAPDLDHIATCDIIVHTYYFKAAVGV